ncbi:MAG: Flp family type IVb pilin [Rhodospirillales bacterium]|nr:Flp family type IVb pilin [Rhodospirillales bacterium]MCB9994984.1 Flp family type IVb pilin [Rhodospirillales bacterium]
MLTNLIAKIKAYAADKDGATAIEYGLIAGGISLAIVAAVFAFGDDLQLVFNTIRDAMNSAAGKV